MSDKNAPGTKYTLLHLGWRIALGVVGVGMVALSVIVYANPPLRWSSEQAGTTPAKVTSTQAEATTYSVALVGIGAVALLLAANGLKLVSLSNKDATFATDPDRGNVNELKAESAKNTVKVPGEDAPEPKGKAAKVVGDDSIFEPEDIPIQVLADLLKDNPDAIRTAADVEYATRERGKGNHPWYLKLTNGESYKVAYGGRGKSEGTANKVE
jgi:hypothetical protein